MIRSIHVHQRKNAITYIPWFMGGHVAADSVVISIATEGDKRMPYVEEQPRLDIVDEFYGPGRDDVLNALALAKAYPERNIVVHCHAGRVRSKWLAEQLCEHLPTYRLHAHRPHFVLHYEQR